MGSGTADLGTAGLMLRSLALAASVIALGAGGCGTSDTVADYCAYGAISQAQLDGCREHATEGDVSGRNTNAARYARGDLDECLQDSGPFCEPR